jgi:hypothetical protein
VCVSSSRGLYFSLALPSWHEVVAAKWPSSNSAVAPDGDRCFTVLQEPSFMASRSPPANCRPLGRESYAISRCTSRLKRRTTASLLPKRPD